MRKLNSPGNTQERGEIYWARITSFSPGATLALAGENPIAVDSLGGFVCQKDRPWKQVDLSGTISIEYGVDPREPYPGPVGSIGQGTSVNPTSVVGEPSGNGLTAYGRVVAPLAAGVIAQVISLPVGTYDVEVETSFGATVAAGDEDNMQLVVSGAALNKLINPPVANGVPNTFRVRRIFVFAGTSIQIQAVAGGTVGSIYKAQISAVQVS